MEQIGGCFWKGNKVRVRGDGADRGMFLER